MQFVHRVIAYTIAIYAVGLGLAAWRLRALRVPAAASGAAVLLQIALGVATVVYEVPAGFALLHQANALLLFAASLGPFSALAYCQGRDRNAFTKFMTEFKKLFSTGCANLLSGIGLRDTWICCSESRCRQARQKASGSRVMSGIGLRDWLNVQKSMIMLKPKWALKQEPPGKRVRWKKPFRIEEEDDHLSIWKMCYADFMTALMAFFLLMWLANSFQKKKRPPVLRIFTIRFHRLPQHLLRMACKMPCRTPREAARLPVINFINRALGI